MTDIGLVGAGLGGLTAAIALAQAGHKVSVYERADELGEVGAGISVPPNAAKVLAALGLQEALSAISTLPSEGYISNGETGERVATTPFGDVMREHFGQAYYQAHRADLHSMLTQALKDQAPEALHLGKDFKSVDDLSDGVRLHFEDGSAAEHDILIGADGVRSRVREVLFGAEAPRFTRFIAWRALIPMGELPDAYKESVAHVRVGHNRNFTHYPIRHGTFLNCVMFAGDSDWREEGWNIPGDINEIRAAYDGWVPEIQTLIDKIPSDNLFKWALYDREPLETFYKGRTVLMGDAAHPMLPFLGQGASMAIEDAAHLAHALNADENVEAAFAAYQTARKERANWVLLESREAGARFSQPVPSAKTFSGDQAMRARDLFTFTPPDMTAAAHA